MAIKITVTGNKYPGGSFKSTYGSYNLMNTSTGKSTPVTGVIKDGLMLRIQDSIKDTSSPINAQVTKAMEKAARARIAATRQQAINHFGKTIDAALVLVRNSKVPAVSGGLGTPYMEKGANYARIVRPAIPYAERKSITANISAPEVGVNTTQSWKTLNHYYFNRSPKSQKFFTKRRGTQDKSSRVIMLSELAKVKTSSISTSHNIGLDPLKGTPASVSGKKSLTMKYSYTLAFPSLHKFDFIRKAYVHSAQGQMQRFPNKTIEVDGKNVKVFDKSYGILYAERLRPFFRVLAAEAGKDLRKQLTTLKLR